MREGSSRCAPHSGMPRWRDAEPDHDAGKADHRADRQVEFAGDDEERRGGRDDAEFGRQRQEGQRALQRIEVRDAPGSSAKMMIVAIRPPAAPASGRRISLVKRPAAASRSSLPGLALGLDAEALDGLRRRGGRDVVSSHRLGVLWMRRSGSRDARRSLRIPTPSGSRIVLADAVLGKAEHGLAPCPACR